VLLQDMHDEKNTDKYETDNNPQTLSNKGLFVGVNTKLFSILREYLSIFVFVSRDSSSFDEKLINDKDVIVIYPAEMNDELKSFALDVLQEKQRKGQNNHSQ
jgi:hypothetical protein